MSGLVAPSGLGFLVPLTLPLALAGGAAVGWWRWDRSANPPQFRAYAVHTGWKVDPAAWLERDLRSRRLASGIAAVLQRLVSELTERHGMTPAAIFGPLPPRSTRERPVLGRARRSARRLSRAYALARLVEDPRNDYFWPRWRRPARRAKARRILDEELSEVGRLWPELEADR